MTGASAFVTAFELIPTYLRTHNILKGPVCLTAGKIIFMFANRIDYSYNSLTLITAQTTVLTIVTARVAAIVFAIALATTGEVAVVGFCRIDYKHWVTYFLALVAAGELLCTFEIAASIRAAVKVLNAANSHINFVFFAPVSYLLPQS